jgi:hypothetical protein
MVCGCEWLTEHYLYVTAFQKNYYKEGEIFVLFFKLLIDVLLFLLQCNRICLHLFLVKYSWSY